MMSKEEIELIKDLYTHTITMLGPCATIAVAAWKYFEVRKAKIIEKSIGAQTVFSITEQMNKMRMDIDRLKEMQSDKTEEIRVLEEDYKNLNMLIIELLKSK